MCYNKGEILLFIDCESVVLNALTSYCKSDDIRNDILNEKSIIEIIDSFMFNNDCFYIIKILKPESTNTNNDNSLKDYIVSLEELNLYTKHYSNDYKSKIDEFLTK